MKTIYINANTLSDNQLGSLGRYTLSVATLLNKINNYKIILLSDVPVNQDLLNLIRPNDIIIKGEKVRGIKSFLLEYLPWVYSIINKYKPDIFFEPQNYLLENLQNTKSIVVIHDLYPLEEISNRDFLRKNLFKHFIKKTLNNANIILTPSIFTKERIYYFFGEYKNIYPIYHGVDLNNYCTSSVGDSKLHEINIKNKDFIFYVGRLCRWKGTDILLDLARDLKDKFNIKLVLAGSPIEKDILSKIDELKNENIIEYLGFIDDLEKISLISKSIAFIYPSRYDGFGQPPLEASKAGTLAIMSNIPVLREVTKGKGVFFDIKNAQVSLLHTINELTKNKEEFLTKNSDLKEYIEKNLTWENYIVKLDIIVNKL